MNPLHKLRTAVNRNGSLRVQSKTFQHSCTPPKTLRVSTKCPPTLVCFGGIILAFCLFAANVSAATHPLDPLWTNELRAAVEIRLQEINLSTERRSSANPHGNGFSLTREIFTRERQARRDLNHASHRRWAVFNPNSISSLGHPAADLIEPGLNSVPFLAKDSPVRQRAGFTEHHFFATRYRATELYPSGDYPMTASQPNNIATWARDNESIVNEDVVVWYTLGVTHVARPEDFPVMPATHASVRLVPKGFFTKNPALDVPDMPVDTGK